MVQPHTRFWPSLVKCRVLCSWRKGNLPCSWLQRWYSWVYKYWIQCTLQLICSAGFFLCVLSDIVKVSVKRDTTGVLITHTAIYYVHIKNKKTKGNGLKWSIFESGWVCQTHLYPWLGWYTSGGANVDCCWTPGQCGTHAHQLHSESQEEAD